MGYSPMKNVLSPETLMDQPAQAQSAHPQPQAYQLHQLHQHHRVSAERLEVLLVGQNQVTPHVVSPKTRAR